MFSLAVLSGSLCALLLKHLGFLLFHGNIYEMSLSNNVANEKDILELEWWMCYTGTDLEPVLVHTITRYEMALKNLVIAFQPYTLPKISYFNTSEAPQSIRLPPPYLTGAIKHRSGIFSVVLCLEYVLLFDLKTIKRPQALKWNKKKAKYANAKQAKQQCLSHSLLCYEYEIFQIYKINPKLRSKSS